MGERTDFVRAECFGEKGVGGDDRGIERGREFLRCGGGWWKMWRARSGSIADFFQGGGLVDGVEGEAELAGLEFCLVALGAAPGFEVFAEGGPVFGVLEVEGAVVEGVFASGDEGGEGGFAFGRGVGEDECFGEADGLRLGGVDEEGGEQQTFHGGSMTQVRGNNEDEVVKKLSGTRTRGRVAESEDRYPDHLSSGVLGAAGRKYDEACTGWRAA